MTRKKSTTLGDFEKFMLIIFGAAFLVVAGFALVYGLLGYFEGDVLRIVATMLVFCLVISFLLGLQIGKATVRGIEHGLDIKLSAKERATPSRATVISAERAGMRYDELLPKVQEQANIVVRREDSTGPLEM